VTVIVILAMLFAFLALRLYSVLGKRTGHEQQPMPRLAEERAGNDVPGLRPAADPRPEVGRIGDSLVAPEAQAGLRALIAADRGFDVTRFLEGARVAYGMILGAFWKGDRDELAFLCDADVLASFGEAIDQREAAGQTLDNRLVRIERARVTQAQLNGGIAHVTVEFEADIAAITRDADGNVVAGSMVDAVTTRDIWTFARDVRSNDPNWKLSETDEG
jgi:predicted lipid-binding transport protein (Tim44 family)